jgi:hypothetical protein
MYTLTMQSWPCSSYVVQYDVRDDQTEVFFSSYASAIER